MKISELLVEKKNSGIETWSVSNMLGFIKKFRKIDGHWERPEDRERWIVSHENPLVSARERVDTRRQKALEDRDKKKQLNTSLKKASIPSNDQKR